MAKSIQQQLDRLLTLCLEEESTNKAHRDDMNTKFETLSRDSANSTQEGSNHTHALKAKGVMGLGSNTAGSSTTIPKFTKLDFPRFNGQDDQLGWLSRCEYFLRHQQTCDEEKVSLASFHLEGIVQLWVLQLTNDIPTPTWAEFKSQQP